MNSKTGQTEQGYHQDKNGYFVSGKDTEAIEIYQATAEAVQAALDGIYNGWAAVVQPRTLTPSRCKALEYQIYINQNFLSRETLNELARRLRAEGVRMYLLGVQSVNGGTTDSRERIAIRPPRMIRAGQEMRAGNLEIAITATPDFVREDAPAAG